MKKVFPYFSCAIKQTSNSVFVSVPYDELASFVRMVLIANKDVSVEISRVIDYEDLRHGNQDL